MPKVLSTGEFKWIDPKEINSNKHNNNKFCFRKVLF